MNLTDHPSYQSSSGLRPGTDEFPWPTAPLDIDRLRAYYGLCREKGVGYELGAKARDVAARVPDYHAIDCSGWVRAAVAAATGGAVLLPDGSVRQGDWCRAQGLKPSSYAACGRADGVVRLCFIRPSARHPIGHVWLAHNRATYESHAPVGVDSRPFFCHVLTARVTDVYVLALPGARDPGEEGATHAPA